MKEQKGHHRAHVVELDPVGRIQPHRALDRVAADLQHAHATLLDDLDRLAGGEPFTRTFHDFPCRRSPRRDHGFPAAATTAGMGISTGPRFSYSPATLPTASRIASSAAAHCPRSRARLLTGPARN